MKRKVIQIANSTQLVSLPRKWAIENSIKKGDELSITEIGGNLQISTGRAKKKGDVNVDISNLDRDSIMYYIRSLYKNGYDTINVRFSNKTCKNFRKEKNENVIDVVSQEVTRLSGVEVFSQNENSCTIISIAEETGKAFDIMLRRIFLLVSETLDDFITGYKNENKALLKSVKKKHDTITIFVSYSIRLLNKIGVGNIKRPDITYHILEIIDIIVDLIKYNAWELLENNVAPSAVGVDICEQIRDSFKTYYELYYSFDTSLIQELNRNRYEIFSKIENSKSKLNENEWNVIVNMSQLLEHTLNLTNSRIALEHS